MLIARINRKFNKSLLPHSVLRVMTNYYTTRRIQTIDSTLCIAVPDTWYLVAMKTIHSFEYLLKYSDFDYLFRTNLGSYVHLENLQNHLQQMPRRKLYLAKSGTFTVRGYFENQLYGSGSGFAISRDVVERLVVDKKDIIQQQLAYNGRMVDDVLFGRKIISDYGIDVIEGKRTDANLEQLQKDISIVKKDDYHIYFRKAKDVRCFDLVHNFMIENSSNKP